MTEFYIKTPIQLPGCYELKIADYDDLKREISPEVKISRRFKVVVGPFSYWLKQELTRLSLSSYTVGKSNGEPALIDL